MNKITSIALATAVSLGFVANANADAGKYYVTGEVGYGFVTTPRGKITATPMDKLTPNSKDDLDKSITKSDEHDLGTKKSMGGVQFAGGVGYNVTDCFRVDAKVGYASITQKKKDKKTPDDHLEVKSIRALVTGYYDFATNSNFIPFVKAGIGIQSNKYKKTLPNVGDTSATDTKVKDINFYPMSNDGKVNESETILSSVSSKRKTGILYSVGAGFGYKLDENMFLDVTYSFENMYKGEIKTPVVGARVTSKVATSGDAATHLYGKITELEIKNSFKHSVTMGLRVQF